MLSNDVVAQEEQLDEGEALLEEVLVTGSRIARADIDSASPVTVIERAEMEITGLTDVGDLLQSMPSMSGSPIGTTTNNGGNGAVLIDLRGMGTARTLTLVNGKRVVDGGDYQAIPSTMIERVEILKDGASAIYGADAVAGVVNIITRRDFTGMELTAQTADWADTDGAGQDSFGLIAGREFESGNFVFGAEYVKQEGAFQRDVPWDFLQDSYYIYPDGCEKQVAAPYDGTSSGGCYPIGSSRIPESRLPFYSQGLFLIGQPASAPYQVGLMEPHDGRTYNYAPVNYLQTPYERTNVFGEAHFELTENVSFYSEFRGNLRESAQQLAPLPFTGGDPMYDGFYVDPADGQTVAFTGISPDNYYLRAAVDAYNDANGTSLIYEPVVNPRRRMIETNRRFEQNVTQYQWTAGLEGAFNDMNWDLYINEGHRSRTDRDFGQFSGVRLQNALGPSADLDGDGQPECYTNVNDPGTLIVGCVPLNLFGGGVVDAGGNPTTTTLTPDMVDYVALDTVDTYVSRQRTAGASLAGANFELPGGELGWAVGWSYWKQEFTYTPDSAKTIGAVTGNVGAGTSGTLTNNAAYAEFLAPLFDNGTQNIYLKGGLRYDDWSAFGSDTTYQIGLEAQAVDSLKLRATYGTVFRAPTIGDLFGGQVDSFPTYTDPCVPDRTGEPLAPGCAQVGVQTDSQVLARVGGNPNLIPETGDTFTAGFVWTPSFGDHGLTLIADYWEINLEDGISSLGVQFTLDECYTNLNQQACALITRAGDYSVSQIIDAQLNVSEQGAKGIDTEIRWDYTAGFGQLQASFLWSHLLERTIRQFADAELEDVAGTFDGSAFASDKANVSFQWMWNDLSVGYLGEYISGMDAEIWFSDYIQKIPSKMFHDIVASYTFDTFGSTTTLSGGITNFTDEEPPYIDIGFNGKTDPSTYRLFGRGYYLRLKWAY
jgi:outer membrane receptor protein involved in Fe transport